MHSKLNHSLAGNVIIQLPKSPTIMECKVLLQRHGSHILRLFYLSTWTILYGPTLLCICMGSQKFLYFNNLCMHSRGNLHTYKYSKLLIPTVFFCILNLLTLWTKAGKWRLSHISCRQQWLLVTAVMVDDIGHSQWTLLPERSPTVELQIRE